MFYIPPDWLSNPGNSDKVHKILEKHYHTDLRISQEEQISKAIYELQAINENIIIEKLKSGAFCV